MLLNSESKQALDYAKLVVRDYERTPVSRVVHSQDDMAHTGWDIELEQYFRVGREAIEIIVSALPLTRTTSIRRVLDLPSGFGRVTRHLRAAFPDAYIHCCELYEDRVDFCRDAFGVKASKSKEDFDEIQFDRPFDLIWCGSLLTHLPETLFAKALQLFSRSLSPGGIAFVTTQGRHTPYIQKNLWKYMSDEIFQIAEADFTDRGFGYVDYNERSRFFEQESYGITLSSPAYVMGLLTQDPSIRVEAYIERRWDKCQDVVVFKKLPIHSDDD